MNRKTMLKYQGDRVLVVIGEEEVILTIVRYVDGDHSELQLVNRSDKTQEPLTITQSMLDNLVALNHPEANWKLILT
jgi:hypothetical protein